MKRILYLDLVGGAAGDMLMAALLDLGGDLEAVRGALAAMGLHNISVTRTEAWPAGLRATRVDVALTGYRLLSVHGEEPDHAHTHGHAHAQVHDVPHTHAGARPYREIRAMIEGSSLPDSTKALALSAFAILASAEGSAHGVPVEEVTFHEVGGDDAIADIVGVAALITALAPDEIVVSPVPIGRGLTRGAHGPIPLPGPAVLAILTGVPLAETGLQGETVTPTGAALLKALATRFGPMPSLELERSGSGAGHRAWPDRPNIVRAILGRGAELATSSDLESQVEANIDDMSPQHFGALERELFRAGAADVWCETILMKKGRLGTKVCAIVATAQVDAVAQAYLRHSTTLGVRVSPLRRIRAERHLEEIETRFGRVRVKRSDRGGPQDTFMPEHDDCERLAELAGVPVRAVWEEALVVARTERKR